MRRDTLLYLIEILHQTTTGNRSSFAISCCILSKFYIKPQQPEAGAALAVGCILSKFYIKPQLWCWCKCYYVVVSYRNSTSNHNLHCDIRTRCIVVSYRNSTSNHNFARRVSSSAFVVSYRNSTSNHNRISRRVCTSKVVSYRNSTSNHNTGLITGALGQLYLIEILHQTTTASPPHSRTLLLYLIEILHQTTTYGRQRVPQKCCILSKFYIKPQLPSLTAILFISCILSKFYIKPQLSRIRPYSAIVVSYRNSTSNHN